MLTTVRQLHRVIEAMPTGSAIRDAWTKALPGAPADPGEAALANALHTAARAALDHLITDYAVSPKGAAPGLPRDEQRLIDGDGGVDHRREVVVEDVRDLRRVFSGNVIEVERHRLRRNSARAPERRADRVEGDHRC